MNIVDYAKTATDDFRTRPFGEVDSLVLCQIAYLHLEGVLGARLADVYALCNVQMAQIAPTRTQQNSDLLAALAESRRFADVRILEQRTVFDTDTSCQFSATLFLVDEAYYLACRGTDGTLVGWKEDLDLLYVDILAAQSRALAWLNELTDRPLLVGGHSKGGNLALYAAAFCTPSVQRNIVAVFDHDGPGFRETILAREGYARIVPRVHKTVPEMCVFGHILEDNIPYRVVCADGNGVYQHLPFNWQCNADGTFVMGEGITVGSQIIAEFCDKIVPAMTMDERKAFVGSVYESLRYAEVNRVGEIASFRTLQRVLRYNRTLPKETRRKVNHCVRLFIAVILGSSYSVTEEYIVATFADWRIRRQERRDLLARARSGEIILGQDEQAVGCNEDTDQGAVIRLPQTNARQGAAADSTDEGQD